MPSSTLFPNLLRITVVGEQGYDDLVRSTLEEMAQRAGIPNWVDFVKLRERDDIEVVELPPLGSLY